MNQFDMSFVHNGIHIMNPTLSEDGRESVSPEYYGFSIEQTGGGSTVWAKYFDNGNVLVLGCANGDCTHNLDNGFVMSLFDGSKDYGTFGNCLGILEADEIV